MVFYLSSYICMDDSMKIPHGMVDHEIQTDLQVFEELNDEQVE